MTNPRMEPMSDNNPWKTVTVPKALYLPTIAGESFKDTGLRVEPTDTLELNMGSNVIRVNGVEHRMLIPCGNLRIDEKGCIQLDKPKAPAPLSAGGAGKANVGRMGTARAAASANWDHAAAEAWEGDAASPPVVRGFPVFQDETPAFGHRTASPTFSDTPDRQWSKEEQAVIDEMHHELIQEFTKNDPDTDIKEITLRDGSKAFIRIDKKTGREIGTPFRTYGVQYGADGQQVGQSLAYAGPNARFDMDAYRKQLAEQSRHAEVAPSTRDLYDQATPKNAPRTLQGSAARPAPPATPAPPSAGPVLHMLAASTGAPHLDALIGGKNQYCTGFPIGYIVWLQGPQHLRQNLLSKAGASTATSLEAALGKMFMLKGAQAPIITVEFESFDTEVKLQLAEDLPGVYEQLNEQRRNGNPKAALVVSTPELDDPPKALLFFCGLRISIAPHEKDPRFMTAIVTKSMVSDTQGQQSTFPIP